MWLEYVQKPVESGCVICVLRHFCLLAGRMSKCDGCEFVLVSLVMTLMCSMQCLFGMQHPVIICNSATSYSCLCSYCVVTLIGVEPNVKSLYST
ncbi:hypothetical protein LDENG_00134570 [Lucifuga dentata]|nr:hypothetical protein LDENG_00134570 [Lucifuga dentata]